MMPQTKEGIDIRLEDGLLLCGKVNSCFSPKRSVMKVSWR